MAEKWLGAVPFDPKVNKPIQLPHGGIATEYTATIELNGKYAVVPQIWFKSDKPVYYDRGKDQLMSIVQQYEDATGKSFPRFDTISDADKYAIQRSKSGGASKSLLTRSAEMNSKK